MNKLFYKIRKNFWLDEKGHLKLRGYLASKLRENLYRQNCVSLPTEVANKLPSEEQWLLDELCEEYLTSSPRELAFLILGYQDFPGVYTIDALLKAFTQMREQRKLTLSDVMLLIEYRKKRFRGGSKIIAWVRNLVFHDCYFSDKNHRFLAKQAFMNDKGYLVDTDDDDLAIQTMLDWNISDVNFVRQVARYGNANARQMFYNMASLSAQPSAKG